MLGCSTFTVPPLAAEELCGSPCSAPPTAVLVSAVIGWCAGVVHGVAQAMAAGAPQPAHVNAEVGETAEQNLHFQSICRYTVGGAGTVGKSKLG